MAAGLTTSRDRIATAAARHLVSLAYLATVAEEHNALLADCRSRLAALGLSVGADFDEGVLGDGIVARNVTWQPVPADGLLVHALKQIFTGQAPRDPFIALSLLRWLPSQLTQRPDG